MAQDQNLEGRLGRRITPADKPLEQVAGPIDPLAVPVSNNVWMSRSKATDGPPAIFNLPDAKMPDSPTIAR